MFSALKKSFSNFAKKIVGEEEDIQEEEIQEEVKEEKPKKAEKKTEKKKKEKKKKPKKEVKKEKPKEEPVEEPKEEKVEEVSEEVSEEIKEEVTEEVEETIEEEVEEKPKKGFLSRLIGKKEEVEEEPKEEEKVEEESKEEEKVEEVEEKVEEPKEEEEIEEEKPKKGFLSKITGALTEVKVSDDKFNDLFEDLEVELLQNNIAYAIVDKIKETLAEKIVNKPMKKKELDETLKTTLHDLLLEVLEEPNELDIEALLRDKEKPIVVLFVGVNGTGKTTSLAKVSNLLLNKGHSCIFAASDTFRAAAIQQLEVHANNLNVKMIKHDYGADAAAVAFDAIESAKAKGIDFVLVDTAGRTHANEDLMAELAKVRRVTNPDLVILTVDSLTGNDAVEQAKYFDGKIGIDARILTQVDGNEKGGAVISVVYETKKPILFIGTGQEYKDLEEFDSNKIVDAMLS